VKGRSFDRLDAKLNQLARFDSNELVSIDLQAVIRRALDADPGSILQAD
jgi:hypothetical protein